MKKRTPQLSATGTFNFVPRSLRRQEISVRDYGTFPYFAADKNEQELAQLVNILLRAVRFRDSGLLITSTSCQKTAS